jgi:hypothetical protein
MNNVVYVDDFQIVDIEAAKRDLTSSLVRADAPAAVIERLRMSPLADFVFVSIDIANPSSMK